MSFPASTKTLHDWVADVRSRALKIKAKAASLRTASAAGPINRSLLRGFQRDLYDAKQLFDAAAAVPGILAFAQEQLQAGGLLVSDFTAMSAGCDTLRDWIHQNFPTANPSGAELMFVVDANGFYTELTFTTAQTADFRTNCSALEALIT